jgi:ABC-2 type transport system permease protein
MTFAGTWALLRFYVRLDRIRVPVWLGGIAVLVWSSAASVVALYPTQADLDKAAATAQDNAALIALSGAPVGLDTLGGQVVFNIGAFGYVVMALMAMFLIGRHARGDEEAGRTELVRAAEVGRNAPLAAALVEAAGALAVAGALITLIMVATDLPVAGSVAYGAAMTGFGLVFAGVTAVAAQVTEHNRAAYGITGAVLGLSYVIRAVGDVGSGALSWLSPMGWAMGVRPYAGERWWSLGLLAVAAVGLVAVAAWLLAHRDLGAGLIAPRPGPAEAAPSLSTRWGLAVRLQRASLLGWAAGLVASGVAYGSVGKDVGDLIGDNNTVADLLAQGGGSLTDTFFATSTLILALITGGFAVAAVLRLRSEETSGRAEPLLATSLSRSDWAGGHLAVAVLGTLLVLAATGLGMGLTYGLSVHDLGQTGRLVGAAVAFAPALWVLIGVALALFGLFPRAAAAAWGVLALCFVIGLFGELFDLPDWVIDLSPFQHVPGMPAQGFDVVPLAVLTAIAAALVAAGLAGLRRRDITAGA